MTVRIIQGDALARLRELPDDSVHCCVTSPPYWGLRDYGVEGQIGLEPTPDAWAVRLVEVFREVRRVLRPDGTCFVNVGDSYAQTEIRHRQGIGSPNPRYTEHARGAWAENTEQTGRKLQHGCKPKDLIGQPWLLAFALRADGWYLRGDYIWNKPNPMPESVTDRCTKSHEYIFHFSKSARYYWDQEAMREALGEWSQQALRSNWTRQSDIKHQNGSGSDGSSWKTGQGYGDKINPSGRNARSVWTIATEPFPDAHFATFPTELARRCIRAGCPANGTVLDPFGGSGTVAVVAEQLDRDSILIELSPDYAAMAERRIAHAKARRMIGDAPKAIRLPGQADLFANDEVSHAVSHGASKPQKPLGVEAGGGS